MKKYSEDQIKGTQCELTDRRTDKLEVTSLTEGQTKQYVEIASRLEGLIPTFYMDLNFLLCSLFEINDVVATIYYTL